MILHSMHLKVYYKFHDRIGEAKSLQEKERITVQGEGQNEKNNINYDRRRSSVGRNILVLEKE